MNPRYAGSAEGDPELIARRAERINFDWLCRMYGRLANMPSDGWEVSQYRRSIEKAKQRWADSLRALDRQIKSGGAL